MQLVQDPASSLFRRQGGQHLFETLPDSRGLGSGLRTLAPIMQRCLRPRLGFEVIAAGDVGALAAPSLQDVQAPAGGDVVDPGPERLRVDQGRQLPPDDHERLLDSVFGLAPVTEHPVRQAEELPFVGSDQLFEGARIPVLRPVHPGGLAQAGHRAGRSGAAGRRRSGFDRHGAQTVVDLWS